MKSFEFTLRRPFVGMAKRTYEIKAETEEEAIQKFSDAFDNNQENLIATEKEELIVAQYSNQGECVITETGTIFDIQFDEDAKESENQAGPVQ